MDIAAFWKRVKMLIKAHKIDQKKLAAYIDIPIGTLRAWIHYKRIPDVGTALAMSQALGVTVEYLVCGKENDTVKKDKMARTAAKEAADRVLNLQDKIIKDLKNIKRYF